MTDIVSPPQNIKTMSSREIAKLTGKEHKHVLRDIENILKDAEIDQSKFGHIYLDKYKREQREYRLPYREALLVTSGYDTKQRLKIIDRWAELEVEKRQQPQTKDNKPKVFITGMLLKELRLLANDNAERLFEAGIDNNQIIISTSRVMESVLGVDTLEGVNIPTPNNSQYYTATALGEQLEGKPSGKEINKRLVRLNCLLVEHEPSGKRRNILTPKGKELGGRVFDTGKKHSDGSIVQSIKWQDNILDLLKTTH